MGAIRAPLSNDSSNVCLGVQEMQASRPPMNSALQTANLVMFIVYLVVDLTCLMIAVHYRNRPRFAKVRPIILNVRLVFAHTCFHLAANLSYAVSGFPCALLVIFYTVALGLYAVNAQMRWLAFSVESYYVKATGKEGALFPDEHPRLSNLTTITRVSLVATSLTSGSMIREQIRDWCLLTQVAFGLKRIPFLGITDLVLIKNSYARLTFILAFPVTITWILILALVPPFQTCTDCYIFVELPIGFFVCLIVYCFGVIRTAMDARRGGADQDEFEVIRELNIATFVIVPLSAMVWILMIVDPGEISYNNQFNWSFTAIIPKIVFTYNVFSRQFYVQWKQDRQAAFMAGDIPRMRSLVSSNMEVRLAFQEFAARQYVTESVRFLEDVATFKRFYFEKAENWRQSKFKALVESYILPGSRFEINISDDMRETVIKIYQTVIVDRKMEMTIPQNQAIVPMDAQQHQTTEVFTALNKAEQEIEHMLQVGAWTEFIIKRASLVKLASNKVDHQGTSESMM